MQVLETLVFRDNDVAFVCILGKVTYHGRVLLIQLIGNNLYQVTLTGGIC